MPISSTSACAASSAPEIILELTQADRLEAAAEGAMRRFPAMAARLLDEIARAQLVPLADLPPDVVGLGREVTYRDDVAGRKETVVLVMPREADIAQGRASVLTPIGVALIGLRVGASFTWETRDGESRQLTVTRVE
ncbi:MAG TPA: nucleoside diphosphate kinase regulator [Amaricoccus sp.]|uniref:nucleoside diphosphate kinase regulator n=1 Tax=Amaricoccus sp. TaxID=1872485 RepID=UPI002BD9665D|nr:nucleoside diphosphate kinase regulator [Amaricoccus sp.]HMQ91660.1 nucleoside diphosphate kinase regulator [Amaricoccus sp.]HMR52237.1 nucleoside diphosphate kinase regulator [Amaricoccus sp.]HMT99089.1 nucleoside diphosphate kinase regulator [Amaricoccus sp.]